MKDNDSDIISNEEFYIYEKKRIKKTTKVLDKNHSHFQNLNF